MDFIINLPSSIKLKVRILLIITDRLNKGICNGIPPEVTCRVTCGVRIERLGPDQGLAKGRVSLELHE